MLIGQVDGHAPEAAPTGVSRGTWLIGDDGALALTKSYWHGDSWFFPEHPDAVVDDGLVRVRIEPGSRVDSTVMARATYDPKNLDNVTGYGVSVSRDKLSLNRWDHGLAFPITPALNVSGMSNRDSLEVTFLLTGPFLVGQVWDGETFELLGTVSGHDTGYKSGAVGLRAYKKQDAATRVALMSAMDREAAATESDDIKLVDHSRRVVIAAADVEQLPANLRDTVEEPIPDQGYEAEQVVLTVDPAEYEQLMRTDIELADVAGDLPWYWFDERYARRRGKAPRRTETGFVLSDSYKDSDMVEAIVKGYAKKYPNITKLVDLGKTHQGQSIWALKISDNPTQNEDEPSMFLNGAHHGSELLSTEYTLDAIQVLLEQYGSNPRVARYVNELEIWAVPLVNPDGNKLFMTLNQYAGRKNGRDVDGNGKFDWYDGVDLNRNYPFRWGALGELGSKSWKYNWWYRGPEPGSEPEIRAVMKLAEAERFAGSMTYHTNGTVLISPYSIDGVDNPDPDVAWNVANYVQSRLPVQANKRRFKVVRKIYSVDGTDQDWHYFQNGTMALLLEGSHHNPTNWWTAQKSIEATRPAFQALFDRFIDGPSISGHVVTKKGELVEAAVTIEEVEQRAGEIWTTRPRDGRFDRYVPSAGTYTVTARAVGWQPVSVTVEVSGHETVDIELRKKDRGGRQGDL